MHSDLEDVRAAVRSRAPAERSATRNNLAAVAMLVGPARRMWFIRRAEHPQDRFSGHIGFPGGKMELRDEDLRATAIRETREEVGIDLTSAEFIGALDDRSTHTMPPLIVRPYVFALDHMPQFDTNEEVASIHSTTLDFLLSGEGRGEKVLMRGMIPYALPCVDFDGVQLWGVTLGIVDDLLLRLRGASNTRVAGRMKLPEF